MQNDVLQGGPVHHHVPGRPVPFHQGLRPILAQAHPVEGGGVHPLQVLPGRT